MEAGYEIECVAPVPRPKFGEMRSRPVRLSKSSCELIRKLYRTYRRPYFFLEEAPKLQTWGRLGSTKLSGSFDHSQNVDRWVDLELLRNELKTCFVQAGGHLQVEESVFLPDSQNHRHLEVIDVLPEQLSKEQRHAYFPQSRVRKKIQVAEFVLNGATDRENGTPNLEFLKVENSLVFCESLNDSKILTVFSASRYGRERVVNALKNPKAGVPIKWKAMILRSSGYRQAEYAMLRGLSGFYRPGVIALGQSLGSPSAISNLGVDYGLAQASRAFERICSMTQRSSALLEAEDWRREESAALLKGLRRGRMVENLLFKEQWAQGAKAQILTFLPPNVRSRFASPV